MAENKINKYRMVIIGGSAGSLDVILKIVSRLQQNTGVSFVIIVHRKNDADSILPSLLAYKTTLSIKEVEDKEPILPDTIYIAPADYHLLIENENYFSLDSSEKIHFSRPSIDVSFESAAIVFKDSLIGIILSGANADGAAGLNTIKKMGGYTIAQDPTSADVGFMPQQAIKFGQVDAILHTENIADHLVTLLTKN